MTVVLDMPVQEASTKPSRSRTAWFMTFGFLVYTLLILVGHIVGFPLAYAYLHTVCPRGCELTPANVHALGSIGLSVAFYANLYTVIQVVYVLVCVGIAVLIVFKKPGQWVPLGLSCGGLGFSAYEGADYPALAAAHPALNTPLQLLIYVGMGALGGYALMTFPNGRFGRRWIPGLYLFVTIEGLLALFITNPVFVLFNTIWGVASFPLLLLFLIYRYRRILNTKERVSMKWLILGWSVFIPSLVFAIGILPAITSPASLAFLAINTFGFFGCGINIAGTLMAVMYANAFDIDIFVRRTLVYTLLTATLVVLYIGMVFGSQFVLDSFSAQAAQSPLILVGSTLVIAVLFQPFRQRIQTLIDRRFYRQKYDAAKIVAAFSSTLRQEVDLDQLREHLLAVVQETMQPAHVSLWLRPPDQASKKQATWSSTPPAPQDGEEH
jgi:hypothetical protein